MPTSNRPLSPHLQIYRPQITSVLSILHRITGFGLAAGAALVTWWLVAAAAGAETYETFHAFATSPFGRFFLFGFLWALCYHLLNGVRHLAWDCVWGLELKTAEKTGWAVVAGSALLTLLFWVMA